MQRFATVTRVRPEKLEQYKELHAKPWADVLEPLDAVLSDGNRAAMLAQTALRIYRLLERP